MPTDEKIILDPSEVATNRDAFDITCWIDQEGADWGEATIEPYMGQRERGEVPVDFRVPNREAVFPLVFKETLGGTTTAAARSAFQSKVALFQKEGGWLKRVLNTGGTVYADIVDASLAVTSWTGQESSDNLDLEATMTLNLLPDFYQDEIILADHTETTLPEITFSETSVLGDYPARVRMVVDDDQGQDQRGLIWGYRSRHYSAATTAALAYQAESLGPVSPAGARALSGASGGTVVRQGTISTSWTPVMTTNMGGTAYLTHTGTYRLYARVYSTSGTTVQARAVWDVNDLVNPVENEAWRLPGASNFYLHDFGEVRLDPSPVGTHRWQGQIQAKGDVGTENFSVDRIELVPVDEGMGVLRAPLTLTEGLATYSARSEFRTESGTITGDTLAIGGTWAGAGDTNDFLASGGTATRTATADTDLNLHTGRLIRASTPTTLTNTTARLEVRRGPADADDVASQGLIVRWNDISNFAAVFVKYTTSSSLPNLIVRKRVAAGYTTLGTAAINATSLSEWTRISTVLTASGNILAWAGHGNSQSAVLSFSDTDLATGGALDNGTVGIVDFYGGADPLNRYYRNFAAWVSPPDAVTFASQSTQLTTDGNYRLDSGGTAYGPVSISTGDLPRLPVAGLESRTTQVFLKPSRGDFEDLPDSGIDDISARVYYRPSYLTVGTL